MTSGIYGIERLWDALSRANRFVRQCSEGDALGYDGKSSFRRSNYALKAPPSCGF